MRYFRLPANHECFPKALPQRLSAKFDKFPLKGWVAGGAMLGAYFEKEYIDIDIWFEDATIRENTISYYGGSNRTSEFADTFDYLADHPVQFIKTIEPIEATLRGFDIVNCRLAYNLTTKEICGDLDALKAFYAGEIEINSITVKTLERTVKYCKRYSLQLSQRSTRLISAALTGLTDDNPFIDQARDLLLTSKYLDVLNINDDNEILHDVDVPVEAEQRNSIIDTDQPTLVIENAPATTARVTYPVNQEEPTLTTVVRDAPLGNGGNVAILNAKLPDLTTEFTTLIRDDGTTYTLE